MFHVYYREKRTHLVTIPACLWSTIYWSFYRQVSVSGKAALLALLNYFHLVPNVITILSYFYPQCTIQPVSVVDNSSTGSTRSTSGPSTATTPGRSSTNWKSLHHGGENDGTWELMKLKWGLKYTSNENFHFAKWRPDDVQRLCIAVGKCRVGNNYYFQVLPYP